MNAPLTDFPIARSVTVETDETVAVTNREFLDAVFEGSDPDARALVVSFPGNPSKVAARVWGGDAWERSADTTLLPATANNYFSVATFRPDDAGRFRRRKASFAHLHAVMLDDVGTKVEAERLDLPVSWKIETSPGNFQVGYLFEDPIAETALADRLMKAIIAAGLCDPGAGGPTARLARLPVGVNGKHAPAFQCRLVEWVPHRRYTIDDLVEELQLDWVPAKRSKRAGGAAAPPADDEAVWTPRPASNAVLDVLKNRGLYKAPLGNGRHDITCPWVIEHTDQLDHGTAYFEPDEQWAIGGFKCLHGHCAHRHVRDLLGFLGIEPAAARMKAVIRLVAGEIHRIVDAGEQELALTGRYYQRGGLIVTVVTDPGTRETRIQEVNAPTLVRALAGAATWERYDLRSSGWTRTDPPARHAAVLFDSSSYAHLPSLKGLARQPYLRPDGSLATQPGFDSATGLYGVFDAREFDVPENPTIDEAQAALMVLTDLLSEFRFATPSARTAALAAMLTAAIRASLELAPMFHVRAHVSGSGKSYLSELITAFATPQRGTPTAFPADDEECRKLLLADLLRGPAVIEFDNLTGDLIPHKSLCSALTSEFMSGRILGVSKTATVNTRTLFLSSGNNVGPVRDMARRCITIDLDPGCEVPASRTFARPDLVREVLRDRGRYVSAALTLVRAWIGAGRPTFPCKVLGSFGDWSELCRQPLLWLGLPDPCDSVFEALNEDPDRETLGRLLTAWDALFGNRPTMLRDALTRRSDLVDDEIELREVLHDIAGERGDINRRRLGWWMKRHVGQLVNGLRLGKSPGNGSAERWRVESVSPVSKVPVTPIAASVIEPDERNSTDGDAYARASRGH